MNLPAITREPFGTVSGQPVERYTLRAGGVEADLLTYGATLAGLRAPDRHGQLAEITLGFETLAGYLTDHPYFGSTVGRYANRIAAGRFILDGQPYTLPINNGPNHLHGGPAGFHRQIWLAEAAETAAGPSVVFRYHSPDGEAGYPGALDVQLTVTLAARAELRLEYRASAAAPTVVSLTNHTYFNLDASADVLDHTVQIAAPWFLPVDQDLIPTGELRAIAGTPLDLRAPRVLREVLRASDPQLAIANGLDHCYVLGQPKGELVAAAQVSAPNSGRVMDVLTTAPGLQLYTGNFLDGAIAGRGGRAYGKHAALCLEAQSLPDAPNQPTFPSAILRPGELYHQTTIYRLSSD